MIACICHNVSYTIIDKNMKDGVPFKTLVTKKLFGTQCKKCLPDIKTYMRTGRNDGKA